MNKAMILCCATLSALVGCKPQTVTLKDTPPPALPEGAWFQPDTYVWALQKVDPLMRKEASKPWREVVQEGRTADIALDWKSLTERTDWQRAVIQVAGRADELPFYEKEFTSAQTPAVLPMLPPGGYWLTVRTYGEGLTDFQRLFLNVLESPVTAKDRPTKKPSGLQLQGTPDGQLVVSGWKPQEAATLRLKIGNVEGDVLREEVIELPTHGDTLTLPLQEAAPGKTLVVGAELRHSGLTLDQAETWTSLPGDFPATAPAWPSDAAPQNVLHYLAGETMATSVPFAEQQEALETQIAGMAQRGSRTIQLWVLWGKVDPLGGARDWSNIDAYVEFLTKNKIPFTFASISSVLFGNAPEEAWSEWAMNDRGEFGLWRKLPMTSPVSPTYLRKSPEFIRALVERYRGNPYLAGYVSLGQGLDSGVFQDQHETVMDYSAVARDSFRDYLRKKYTDLAALNQAWGTNWQDWSHVLPPMAELHKEVNLTPAWQDWTAWKLQVYRGVSVGLVEPIIAELDPDRPVLNYNAKTGPFEYQFHDLAVRQWGTADGAGEDYRMGRINSLTKNWGLWRQTESHDVPPANKRYMMDMWAASLRNGGDLIRYNLVFNSQAISFLTLYPKNEALQASLAWWSETAPLREKLSTSATATPETGIILSWADMLFRKRVFRWYTMPGDRAEEFTRQQGFQPVKWLSEWTPESAWTGLRRILVPEDALVWDPALQSRLARFVQEGGHAIIWGRAGQYSTDAAAGPFSWLQDFGVGDITAEASAVAGEGTHSTVTHGDKRYTLSPAVSVTNIPAHVTTTTDGKDRPVLLEWTFGKGKVTWCLSDTPGESERLLTALLKDSGARREVVTSDPRVDGLTLYQDGSRYIVLSRYLGFGKKADDTPVKTKVTLPELPDSPEWIVRSLVPAAPEQRLSGDQLASTGWETNLLPSEMQIYEIVPAPVATR